MKNRIIAETLELFLKYGIKNVTMDDIATHLGISKKTIYQYFKDKDDLVVKIVKPHLEQEQKNMEEIADSSQDAIEELYKIWKYLKVRLENMNHLVIHDMKKYHFKAYKLFEKHKEECIGNSVRKNLLKGVKDECYRNDIDIDILAKLKIFEVELAFDIDVFPMDKYKLVDVQLEFFNHFFYGISTPKGQELYKKYEQLEA